MSFSRKVLLALAGGIATGLFFGELVAPLHVVAEGFIKLLQMTVLPYVTVSIITSVGSLDLGVVRKLGLRAGAVIVALWLIALLFCFLMPLAFPSVETASFFSTTLVERRAPFNFIDLYIPSNPFHALANNVVPAVVLFSLMLGVALIGIPRKQALLDSLSVIMAAISRAAKLVVQLTPYGVFAIAGHAAGTLSLAQVGQIQVYLIAYGVLALILAFVVLPGLVSTLTGIPLRAIFSHNRDVLITAVVAGDLFIVLPGLIDACGQILSKHAAATGTGDERQLPEIIVPVSFNFPHTGKLLSISFVLFAGWLSDAVISAWEYPRLALTGLLTFFGSLNAAVPFLLDVFRIPADTFQLFVATSVINSRFGTLLAVVHTIAVALLGSAAIAGAIRFEKTKLLRYLLTVALVTTVAIGSMRIVFTRVLPVRFDGASMITHMRPLFAREPAVVLRGPAAASAPDAETGSVTAAVLRRGTLRVGYFPNRMPYAFKNAEGQLIGLDVERAHSLAADLGVKAEFIELHTSELESAMASGRCDIIMTGALVTPRRQLKTLFSQSYLDETLAFLVLDHRRDEFLKWDEIRHKPGLRIAVPNLPYYLALIKGLLPEATITGVEPDLLQPDESAGFDAFVIPAERGSTLTLLHPKYTVVVPEPGLIKVPLAYPLAKHDRDWAQVVNSWIELRQKDGTFQALYRHWILGQQAGAREPRWSLLRNVLHWVG